MALNGGNNKHNVDQIASYLSPKKFSDFCRNEVIPKMNNKQFVDALTKNANLISTIMVNHDIDSFCQFYEETDEFKATPLGIHRVLECGASPRA